jgi:hypothetical protein
MWILTLLLAVTPQAFAGEVPVQLLGEDTAIEEIVSQSVSHASADVSGKGSSMQLTYSAQEPLSVFISLRKSNGSFSPFETLQTVLPVGTRQEVTIDLTRSPAWSPSHHSYRLYFFSEASAGAEFHDIEFIDEGLMATLSAAVNHITMKQPYSPASYHRLPGYTVLGIPVTPVIGWLLIFVVIVLAAKKRVDVIIPLIVVVVLIAQARFSIDAIRLSIDHSKEWLMNKTYSTAGSLPKIANKLNQEGAKNVYLCHTGTTYAKKLLQYHSYPALVVEDNPDYIVVHKSTDWDLNRNNLRCGDDTFKVDLIEEYSDGSTLFAIQS